MGKFGVGQAVRRVEDARFLTGSGRYVDDLTLPRQCHGVAVLSPHAHARVRSIDTSRAAAARGVLAVLTGADAAADRLGAFTAHPMPEEVGAPKGHRTFAPVLARERVRYVGERVAYVVAETAAQARDAAELVEIDYDALPAAVALEDAAKEGAPKVHDDCPWGNTVFRLAFGDKEATDAAFAAASHVVRLRLENNRLAPCAMEPRAALARYDAADEAFTLYTTSQNPHGARTELAQVLGVPENRLRVVSPDVGGGFGLKGGVFPDEALALWASRRVGRPVKWVATRSESMLTDTGARDQVVYGEMALDSQGRILAVRARSLNDIGAYFVGPALVMSAFGVRGIPQVYDVKTLHVTAQAVVTNTAPMGPYRGAGRPEAAYLTERLIEAAARETGLAPDEIRRRNAIPVERMPATTPTLYTYDSGEFRRLLDRALELADWEGYEARRSASERKGRLRGRSVAFYIEEAGIFNERMELRFDPGGNLTIVAGTHSHGQGHATAYAQMASEWLGVPFERIRFLQGDTAQVPFGRGSYASRSATAGGNALRLAADAIIEKAKPMAAALMEAAAADLEFKEGRFRVAGTDKAIGMTDVAKAFYAPAGLPDQLGLGLDAAGSFGTRPNYPNGCHVCELEIDPETGEASIDRYVVVDDVGRAINPLIVEGQIHGGVAQGVGQALVEHARYDPESGQLLSGSLMDYALPRADLLPDLAVALEEVPAKSNPLGIKGVGESGTTGAPPAVVNAALDALRPLGVTHLDMPLTPLRVWQAIRGVAAR